MYALNHKWTKVFAKPVHGTDSGGVALLAKDFRISKKSLDLLTEEIMKYCKETFKDKRYPSVIFQKYLKDFEKTVPQARMYYVENQYKYTILNFHNGNIYKPTQDKHETTEKKKRFQQLPALKRTADRVLKSITPLFKGYPKLITRIDFGCCLNKTRKPNSFFVNEIEFNPGLYLHTNGQKRYDLDYAVVETLGKVMRRFEKKRIAFS